VEEVYSSKKEGERKQMGKAFVVMFLFLVVVIWTCWTAVTCLWNHVLPNPIDFMILSNLGWLLAYMTKGTRD